MENVEADSGKRKKESLPGASAWISVGISAATLFYARGTCLGDDNGKEEEEEEGGGEGAWAYGEKPAPDSHFVFSPDARPDKSDCMRRRRPFVPVCS
jgi:hypothetical protein